MKNLYLIPTDKPSRLFIDDKILELDYECIISEDSWITNQHIYITSDEEIKEGVNQWYLDKFLNKPRNSSGSQYGEKQDVIILTTDPDLINDGVQKIDDEFLEWFVKNPSCESVEVVDDLKYFNIDELRERHIKGLPHLYSERIGYKIIIPKEEPKQETNLKKHLDSCEEYQGPRRSAIVDKQETIEEAAAKHFNEEILVEGVTIQYALQEAFIEGAKWMQERMYSEKDLRYAFECATDLNPSFESFNAWFKQFKNKQNCLQIK